MSFDELDVLVAIDDFVCSKYQYNPLLSEISIDDIKEYENEIFMNFSVNEIGKAKKQVKLKVSILEDY